MWLSQHFIAAAIVVHKGKKKRKKSIRLIAACVAGSQ